MMYEKLRMNPSAAIELLIYLPFIIYVAVSISLFGTRFLNIRYTDYHRGEYFCEMFHDTICRLGNTASYRSVHALVMSLVALLLSIIAIAKASLMHRIIGPECNAMYHRMMYIYIFSCDSSVIQSWTPGDARE